MPVGLPHRVRGVVLLSFVWRSKVIMEVFVSQELSAAIQAFAAIAGVLVALFALRQIALLRQQVAMTGDQIKLTSDQLALVREQVKGDHERSRRHLAIQDLHHWTSHIDEKITSARRLCETFDKEQLTSLREGKPTRIPNRFRAIADVALDVKGRSDVVDDGDFFVIPAEYAIRMRNQCIRHLNAFEVTLLGWRHSVSDDHIIEEQLGYLVDLQRDWKMLYGFRRWVTGMDAYPAVEEFVNVIQKKREASRPVAKPPIA